MTDLQTLQPLSELEQKTMAALVDHFEPCGGCGAEPSYADATRAVLAAIAPEIQVQALLTWAAELREARGNRPFPVTPADIERRALALRAELEANRAAA